MDDMSNKVNNHNLKLKSIKDINTDTPFRLPEEYRILQNIFHHDKHTQPITDPNLKKSHSQKHSIFTFKKNSKKKSKHLKPIINTKNDSTFSRNERAISLSSGILPSSDILSGKITTKPMNSNQKSKVGAIKERDAFYRLGSLESPKNKLNKYRNSVKISQFPQYKSSKYQELHYYHDTKLQDYFQEFDLNNIKLPKKTIESVKYSPNKFIPLSHHRNYDLYQNSISKKIRLLNPEHLRREKNLDRAQKSEKSEVFKQLKMESRRKIKTELLEESGTQISPWSIYQKFSIEDRIH